MGRAAKKRGVGRGETGHRARTTGHHTPPRVDVRRLCRRVRADLQTGVQHNHQGSLAAARQEAERLRAELAAARAAHAEQAANLERAAAERQAAHEGALQSPALSPLWWWPAAYWRAFVNRALLATWG